MKDHKALQLFYNCMHKAAEQRIANALRESLAKFTVAHDTIEVLYPGAGVAPSAVNLIEALKQKYPTKKVNLTLIDKEDFNFASEWIAQQAGDTLNQINYVVTNNLKEYMLSAKKYHIIFWEHPELLGAMLLSQAIENRISAVYSESIASTRASFGTLTHILHKNALILVATHTSLELIAAQQLITFATQTTLKKRRSSWLNCIVPIPGQSDYSHLGACIFESPKKHTAKKSGATTLSNEIIHYDRLYTPFVLAAATFSFLSTPTGSVTDYISLNANMAEWGSLGVLAITAYQTMLHDAGRQGAMKHLTAFLLQMLLMGLQFLYAAGNLNTSHVVTPAP